MTVSISAVIPCFNEEPYIAACLDSIIAQSIPAEWNFEIIVVDGLSRDRTREILQDYCRRYAFIRVIDNPCRLIPVALNLGISSSTADFIVRMDSHCTYDGDYVRKCIETLLAKKAENVGGVVRTVGTSVFAKAVALASASPFGVGNAYHRYSAKEQYVDTVSFGAWRRTTIRDNGMFNERMFVNQDYEFNIRLRAAGGRILLNPEVRCDYYARSSPLKLARQYLRYGFWRARTSLMHPGTLKPRQLAPPAFVVALLLSLPLYAVSPALGLLVPVSYLVANLTFTGIVAFNSARWHAALLPVVFAILHLCWGCGFLAGQLVWPFKLRQERTSF